MKLGLNNGVGSAANIDGGKAECFVHRNVSVRRSYDPSPVAQRLMQRLPKTDRNILNGVMLIDMQIADAAYLKVELAMFGNMFEHMVEKSNAGVDLRLS
jgi:hypothetical protein